MSVTPNTKAKLAINTQGFLEKLFPSSFTKPPLLLLLWQTAQIEAGEPQNSNPIQNKNFLPTLNSPA